MLSLCSQWEFTPDWFDGFALGEGTGAAVRLPHTVQKLPLHYADHKAYQGVCGYRRRLSLGPELAGKHLFLQFDGVSDDVYISLRGRELMKEKEAAIANCAAAGLGIVLVPVIARGINDGQVGEVLRCTPDGLLPCSVYHCNDHDQYGGKGQSYENRVRAFFTS